MVKESSNVKKRRKTAATTSTTSTAQSPVSTALIIHSPSDVYMKVVEYEEKEAQSRSPVEDANIYFDMCRKIRSFLSEAVLQKRQNTTESRLKIQQGLTESCVMIAVLKKLNRLDKFRTIFGRESLNTEKQKVDSTNLQYHNLLYEVAHLDSEYKKCKQFKSKDEDIELISNENFLEIAPISITQQFINVELTDEQSHQLHLAILEWELTQRKTQAQLCQTLEEEKKSLGVEILQLNERLEGIGPKLSAVLDASKPLQDYLGLPIDKLNTEHKMAYLLPEPLYLLYTYVDAYKQVFIVDLTVEIIGDADDANNWQEMHQTLDGKIELESDADTDLQEVEEVIEVPKKRRHRKASQVDKNEEKKKILLEGHPLTVLVTIKIKNELAIKIKFCHRPQLNIVTVTSETDIPISITGNCSREILNGDSILKELYDGDLGVESPNTSNSYLLQKVGFGSFEKLVPEIGYAYLWAQNICGYNFLDSEVKLLKANPASVEAIIKSIYKRLNHRHHLAMQLQQLEQNIIPTPPAETVFPKDARSTLIKWVSSDWQNYCQLPSTSHLIENDIVSPNDMFFTATISRSKATLLAQIVIKNNYPSAAPIFSLLVKHEKEFHSSNCDAIRDLERAVNVDYGTSPSNVLWLLSIQLYHLCAYFDVYLETNMQSTFPKTSVYFNTIRGRNRRRPFKFMKIGSGIFTQY